MKSWHRYKSLGRERRMKKEVILGTNLDILILLKCTGIDEFAKNENELSWRRKTATETWHILKTRKKSLIRMTKYSSLLDVAERLIEMRTKTYPLDLNTGRSLVIIAKHVLLE